MAEMQTVKEGHVYMFRSTPAVRAARDRSHFVNCAVCQIDNAEYLFHKVGVRFVRCRSCGLVYVNPIGGARTNYFDIERMGQFSTEEDRLLWVKALGRCLTQVQLKYERQTSIPLRNTLLVGRYLRECLDQNVAKRIGLRIAEVDDGAFERLVVHSEIGWLQALLKEEPQVVFLHEMLEACYEPAKVLERLLAVLPPSVWIGVTYSNTRSIPAVLLRKHWPKFFDFKSCFFDADNLTALMARFDLQVHSQFVYPASQTVQYFLSRVAPRARFAGYLPKIVGQQAATFRTGTSATLFCPRRRPDGVAEKLSIVMPVFNEERYVESVITAVLAKELRIEKELIIVESNSTDSTRAIVRRFETHPQVKLILEERPRGKGHAVKAGLDAATGTVVLVQDADFEYDIDDYDVLLEPILQHRTSFVLGSRTLGLNSWKVRKFASGKAKAVLINLAQLVFANTFNLIYQQRATDINTMFKVFRRECIRAEDLVGNGFNLDIELVCQLVRRGYTPMEVPVNYVSRGFDEGKKVRFVRDALPSYWEIVRNRFVG